MQVITFLKKILIIIIIIITKLDSLCKKLVGGSD